MLKFSVYRKYFVSRAIHIFVRMFTGIVSQDFQTIIFKAAGAFLTVRCERLIEFISIS
jgi:hypothetical protein